MNQLKFYKYAALGLLGLNLTMIAFFILTKPKQHPKPKGGDVPEVVIEILKLDEEQRAAFLVSAKHHGETMGEITQQQKSILEPYFHKLIDSNKDLNSDSLLTQYQNLERQKIELTHQHFQDVKSMLKEDQYANFEVFMNSVLKSVLSEKKKNPHPPKDF